MSDWVLLTIGVLAGAIASTVFAATYESWGRKLEERRVERAKTLRQRLFTGGLLRELVLASYRRRGLGEQLYTTTHLDPGRTVPVLTSQDWLFEIPIGSEAAAGIQIIQLGFQAFEVDAKRIELLKSLGVQIWDDDIMHLVRGGVDEGLPKLNVGRCSYYAYESSVGRLEDQFIRAAESGYHTDLDVLLKSAEEALSEPPKPLVVTGSTVVVFRSEDKLITPIQRRSQAVANSAGMYSVIPSYGLAQTSRTSLASTRNVVFYNFARELAEELYNLDSVIKAGLSSRAGPDWMFDLPEISAIERQMASGQLSLELTGMSIDPSSSILSLAMLAVFNVEGQLEEVLSKIETNFETADADARGSGLHLPDLYSEEIDRWSSQNLLASTSQFSIDRARVRLQATRPTC